MPFFHQIISEFKPDILIGSILFVLGILIGVFKFYWLIAGINTTPKKNLYYVNLRYLSFNLNDSEYDVERFRYSNSRPKG